MSINNNLLTNALCFCDALTLLERFPSGIITLVHLDPPWNTIARSSWNDETKSNYKFLGSKLSMELINSLIKKLII
jgi:hypothetical protein